MVLGGLLIASKVDLEQAKKIERLAKEALADVSDTTLSY
jgi:hypothetical protein